MPSHDTTFNNPLPQKKGDITDPFLEIFNILTLRLLFFFFKTLKGNGCMYFRHLNSFFNKGMIKKLINMYECTINKKINSEAWHNKQNTLDTTRHSKWFWNRQMMDFLKVLLNESNSGCKIVFFSWSHKPIIRPYSDFCHMM